MFSKSNMNPANFYDEKKPLVRKLYEGSSVRNTHNFIKSVLIKRFISKKKKILDLGCGHGGDLLKIKLSDPSSYVGMDTSFNSILAAKSRANTIRLKCRHTFICRDFTKSWDIKDRFDIINCQFAIHFAFKSEETAKFTLSKISETLCEDGLFIGTLPNHPTSKTFEEVCIELPDDDRICIEYAVTKDDFIQFCESEKLKLIMIESFNNFYNKIKNKEKDLLQKMKAFSDPDPNNFVFVFQKRSS